MNSPYTIEVFDEGRWIVVEHYSGIREALRAVAELPAEIGPTLRLMNRGQVVATTTPTHHGISA